MKHSPPDDKHTPDAPRDSLQDYLDELLLGAAPSAATETYANVAHLEAARKRAARPQADARPTLEVAAPRPITRPLPPVLAPPPEPVVPPPVAPPAPPAPTRRETPLTAPVETTTAVQTAPVAPPTEQTSTPAPPAAWLANGRPAWGQRPFECLLFQVGGLKLTVPLVELGTIYPLEAEEGLTPLFGQREWFMGLLPRKGHNLRVVDTARLVMPERYTEEMPGAYRFVLSINGLDWGLAVDSVAEAITLDPEAVRWRSHRAKRSWLAGTVVQHMCALLDVAELGRLLLGQDRNHRRD
ncbi:MAG TPA: chemotaxis protein CheW [Spongiibacteraceae bacterium]|nr:chemotaxis protein CheW [Spongiibacteraceae bacterium]